jgi:hypothetical protein
MEAKLHRAACSSVFVVAIAVADDVAKQLENLSAAQKV